MGHLCLPGHRDHGALRDQQRHGRPLRLIILLGNVKDGGAYHISQRRKDSGKPVRIILLVDIGNIILLLSGRFGITDVVNIKTEGFCQVIKPV